MKMLADLLSLLKEFFLSALYPNTCISCGEIIDENGFLCESCKNAIEVINPKKRCLKCGMEKKNCECSSRVYRFEGIVSLYENTGIAQRAYYKYKLFHKRHYGAFFINELSKAVKTEYSGIDFDGICYVPSSKRSIMGRGFDHARDLCEGVSEITGIKMLDDLLFCKEFRQPQHKSSFEERISNVKGKYGFRRKIKAENILLIDDIRTSGATLDECARQLLRAGADRVYCATVLSRKRRVLKK